MFVVGPTPGLQRSLIWRTLDGLGMEHCELIQADPDHINLKGCVIAVQNDVPLKSFYSVTMNASWVTQHVQVSHEHGVLRLVVRNKRWFVADHDYRSETVDEHELPALAGCIDVDLGLTPATNTLPIRRLQLEVGESATLTAAWVKFPSLDIVLLEQRYERLSEFSYRYSSTNFTALLEVDELGLVTRYEGGWERIAVSRAL
jgi:uncharacterized protein